MQDQVTQARLRFLYAGITAVGAGLKALNRDDYSTAQGLFDDVRTLAQLSEDLEAFLPAEMKADLDRTVSNFAQIRRVVAPTELDTRRARRAR